MPKVPPQPAAMGKQPKKKRSMGSGPSMPMEFILSLEERTELKGIFANPVFTKAFSNAKLRKPAAFVGGIATTQGAQIALIQLSRIQGWEMFEAAMFMQTQDKLPPKAALEENYDDPDLKQ